MAIGALRVVSEGDLQTQESEQRATQQELDADNSDLVETGVASMIRKKWDEFRNHRTSSNSNFLTDKMLDSMRAYNGEYTPLKSQEIAQFGGSKVFARMTSVKCRGASALLRDVFLGAERPWTISPTPVPALPEDILDAINGVMESEQATLEKEGAAVDPQMIAKRKAQLIDSALSAGLKNAAAEADRAETYLNDLLVEGGFYKALVEFLVDLPIFPIACIKGPVVQNVDDLKWVDGEMTMATVPRMFWYRVSPFDVYFTPGASCADDTEVIERIRLRRAELNSLIGVPGYNEEAIKQVLVEYPDGWTEYPESGDAERADLENREDPIYGHGWYDTLEYSGAVQGRELIDYGMSADEVPDADLDYFVTSWLVGRRVIKIKIDPNPRKRIPYYFTSYEKIPGSIYGHGVPEIISDVQDVANAALRSLVNNMSISSGPQVAVNEDRLSPSTNPDSLYPWKRWRFVTDPQAVPGEKPIDFFQPQSNAQELMFVFQNMTNLADEVSAIPKYITGNEKVGGAARTASGLSMLMGNASKVLQMVASNVDNDVLDPLLQMLYDIVMLTDETGSLKGDENIMVKGVTMAIQKDTDRMRRLEFLQMTANPIDQSIVGVDGRAAILRTLADDLGLPGEEIVPSEMELEQRQQQQQAQQQAQQAAQAQGNQAPAPGTAAQAGLGQATDNMQRTQQQ